MEHYPSWEVNRTSCNQKILAFLESRTYTPVFIKTSYLHITPTIWIQSTLPHFIHLIYILISSHLGLDHPNRLLPSGFPIKVLYTFILFLLCTKVPAHFILLHLITLTKSAKKYYSWKSTIWNFPHPPASSSLLVPHVFLSTLFSTENFKYHEINKITKQRGEHHERLRRMYQFSCNRVLHENCASDETLSRDIFVSVSNKKPRIDISRRAFPDIF